MSTTSLAQDYLDRFGGVARLVGAAGLTKLHAAHVCVIGVGGVGSWTVEGLARSGVGAITLIDLDDVCVTNVNRQLPALDGTVGRPKVAVLAERVKLINPGCRVETRMEFFTKESAERLLSAERFDVVVDAIDGMTQKALLIAECVRRGLKCVTVGGAGGKGNQYGVRCVSSAEHPVFPWADGTCSTEQEPGSSLTLDCATGFGTAVWVTAAFGFAAVQEAVGIVTGAGRAGEMTNDQ